MHELLASSLSCLARLAMLSELPLGDKVQLLADREAQDAAAIPQPDTSPVQQLGEPWRAMQHARRALDRISDSLDVGDVPTASSLVMQLNTSIIERHNRERKLFFSVGRAAQEVAEAAGTASAESDLVRRCEEAVKLLDTVAPQIRAHFVTMVKDDEELKAIQFVAAQREEQRKLRLDRLAQMEAKGRRAQQRQMDQRRRVQEGRARALAEEISAQNEARMQFEVYHQAKAARQANAESTMTAIRREKNEMLRQARDSAHREDARLVAMAHAKRAAKQQGTELQRDHMKGRSRTVTEGQTQLPDIQSPAAAAFYGTGQLPPMVHLRQTMELRRNERRPSQLQSTMNLIGQEPRKTAVLMMPRGPAAMEENCGAATIPALKKKRPTQEPGLYIGDSAWQLMKSSELLNKTKKDRDARLHRSLAIETSAAQKYSTPNVAGDEDVIDLDDLGSRTGLSANFLNNYLVLFTELQRGQQNRPMKREKFKKLLRKLHFTSGMITERMFEIFDMNNDKALSFPELVVGLAYFLSQSEEKVFTDPNLVTYMCLFFDLDGSASISQFELYKILQSSFPKKYFQSCVDVLWDVISNGIPGDVEFSDFKIRLEACPALKRILHRIMILQGTEPKSYEYQQQMEPILALTEQWRQAKDAGRINSLDDLARQFMRTSEKSERSALAFTADTMAAVKRGEESLVASYYVKVMRMIMDDGANYVAGEYRSIEEKLRKMAQEKEKREKMAKFLRGESRLCTFQEKQLKQLEKEEKDSSLEQIRSTLEWKKSVMDVFMGKA